MRDVEKLFGKHRERKSFKEDVSKIVKDICEFPVDVESLAGEEGTTFKLAFESLQNDVNATLKSSCESEQCSDESSESEVYEDVLEIKEEEEIVNKYHEIAKTVGNFNRTQTGEQGSSENVFENEEEEENVANAETAAKPSKETRIVNDVLIEERAEQICYFFTLQHNQDIATIFFDLKECLKLQGDFSYLDIVLVSV